MTVKKYIDAWLVLSLLSLFVGLYISYVFILEDGDLPNEAELTTISGQLNGFENKSNGIKFKISGFEPALIIKTSKKNEQLIDAFASSQRESLYKVSIDETREECQKKLDYSCAVWSLKINKLIFLDYEMSVKKAQESITRIAILAKVLIIIGVVGTFALAFLKSNHSLK